MKLKYLPFILIFLSIYLLLNYYVGRSILKLSTNFISIPQKWFWIVLIFFALSYIIAMLLSNYLPNIISNSFQILGSYWMAFFMYGLLLFPVIQLLNLFINKLLNNNNIVFNKILFIELILIFVFFLYVLIFGSLNAKNSYVKTFNINNSKLIDSNGLNIVMVSDIHLGNIIGKSRLTKMVNEINELNPDLIILAGDIVDSDIKPFVDKNMATAFSNLKSKYGVYASLGNHDLMVKDINKLVNLLEKNNVNVLRNEAVLINNNFYIIGRDDISATRFGSKRDSLDTIIDPLDTTKLTIVIDHTPSTISESVESQIDLHFSGHTHKGQVFPGNFITNKIFEIDHGHLEKEGLNVFVSSGYGTWGPPLRLGSKSEIVNVKVNVN